MNRSIHAITDDIAYYTGKLNESKKERDEWYRREYEKKQRTDEEARQLCKQQIRQRIQNLKPNEEEQDLPIAYDVWRNLDLFYKKAQPIRTVECPRDCDLFDVSHTHYTSSIEEGNYTYVIENTQKCPVFEASTSSLLYRENNLPEPIHTYFDKGAIYMSTSFSHFLSKNKFLLS